MATEFPSYVAIRSLDLRAQENVGDKIQPMFKIRFEGEVELREDTYGESAREDDAIIIVPILKSGDRRKLYGVALAGYKAGSWQMQFQFDADPLADIGRPRAIITGGRTLIRGSAEETAFRDERARQIAEAAHAVETRAREDAIKLKRLLAEVTVWAGNSWNKSEKWPMRLRAVRFDPVSATFGGELEWPSLKAVHRLDGTLVGSTVVFKEVEFIRKGDAVLGCVYELNLEGDRRLTGSYGRCGDNAGSGRAELVAQ